MRHLEIPPRFNRSASSLRDPDAAEESASFLIRYVCDKLGLVDLSAQEVLDVGCGTKFTQAFLNRQIPINRYVGIDVHYEMISFLRHNVANPHFEYHHVNVRNELYNPDAPPMSEHSDLGVSARTFDVIWLFSVFTHLAPHDYSTMLKLLRRYARPEGRLIYTLFIDEFTDGGYGFIDKLDKGIRARWERDRITKRSEERAREVRPFVDVYPDYPLRCALYSREYAFELIEGTGWAPLELLPPNEFAQHHFVCAPV
jgi:SAM-dependent methyltransferase